MKVHTCAIYKIDMFLGNLFIFNEQNNTQKTKLINIVFAMPFYFQALNGFLIILAHVLACDGEVFFATHT